MKCINFTIKVNIFYIFALPTYTLCYEKMACPIAEPCNTSFVIVHCDDLPNFFLLRTFSFKQRSDFSNNCVVAYGVFL